VLSGTSILGGGDGLPRWRPPAAREIPEWRSQLRQYMTTQENLTMLAGAVNAGHTSVFPWVEGMDHSPGAIAAPLLARSEAARLGAAALYYATSDMTSLALAVATTPPTEVVRRSRLPSEAGFMVFAEPIGGYTHELNGPVELTTPIVAVSWSMWTPRDVTLTGTDAAVGWASQGPDYKLRQIPDHLQCVWLTFYAAGAAGFDALAPDAVVGAGPGGVAITAGQVAARRRPNPLNWDNEMILVFDSPFGEPRPDTTKEWAQVVYTAWQLMTQQGQPLTDIEELHRDRAGHKRDTRAGITGPTGVRIVHVHSAHRPSKAATEQDAASSTGRRAPQWSCRWPVKPYRRNTCLNPRAHADGGCDHEDRIVAFHVKGPADKPLKITETVHLWDSQPDDAGGPADG
jgi:hypothetical protein